ncbi:MAG: tetratricopeptide repeat protein [Flavobacteriales bacterium]|nr:tetratricopeptide repeat protein [Flavobacteriales bacterium]
MTEEPSNNNPKQVKSQIERFEHMVADDDIQFIDIDDMEVIAGYYMDTFRYTRALNAINIGISMHPFSSTLLLWKAQVLLSDGKTDEAIESLIQIEVLEPTNSEMYLLKGIINSRKKYHQDAIECYKMAIINQESPMDEPYLALAEEYKLLEDFNSAKECLEKAYEIDEDNLDTIQDLAYCYDHLGNFKKSILLYHLILDEEPYSFVNWFNLGLSYFNSEEVKKSIDAFDFAIVIKDDFAGAYYSKACSLAYLQKHEEAIENYLETFKYETPEPITYYALGESYEQLDDLKNAFSYYKKCTDLDPFFSDAWIGMSATFDESNKDINGVEFILKAIEIEPDNSEYWHLYAEVNSKLNQFNKALNAFRQALKLDPNNGNLWIHYANFLSENDKHREAIIVLHKAIELEPENASFYYVLAAFLLLDDCIQEALYYLKPGLSLDYKLHYLLYQYIPTAKNITVARNMIDSYL